MIQRGGEVDAMYVVFVVKYSFDMDSRMGSRGEDK